MTYKKGDIVIVRFPFVIKEGDEKQKGRPAVVISDNRVEHRYKDLILSAITSQVPDKIMEMELILDSNEITGLAKKSLMRLDFIMTVPENLINRKIGVLSDGILKPMDEKLKKLFGCK